MRAERADFTGGHTTRSEYRHRHVLPRSLVACDLKFKISIFFFLPSVFFFFFFFWGAYSDLLTFQFKFMYGLFT